MFQPRIIFFLLFLSTQIIGAISALTWKTFDISSLIVEETAKVSYKDVNGNVKGLETIAKENGANNIKIRMLVTLNGGGANPSSSIPSGASSYFSSLESVCKFY